MVIPRFWWFHIVFSVVECVLPPVGAVGVSPSPLVSQWYRWAKTLILATLDSPATPVVGGPRLKCGQTPDGPSREGLLHSEQMQGAPRMGLLGVGLQRNHTHLNQRVTGEQD